MPDLAPWTQGPAKVLNYGCVGEPAGIIACLYAGDRARFEAIIGPVVPGSVEVLSWFIAPTRTRVRMAVWTQPGHLYVAFGGTHVWNQWPRHGTGVLSTAYKDDDGLTIEGCGTHGFHQACARGMWDEMFAVLPPAWQAREIRVCGHSLGGAVAQLVAWRFAQLGHGPRVQTVTFGAPRCILGNYVGLRPYAEYRVTFYDDLVTHMPPPFTSVLLQGLDAILTVRSGRKYSPQQLEAKVERSFGDRWEHYGDSYDWSAEGVTYRPEAQSAPIHDPWHQVAGRTTANHLIPSYLRRWLNLVPKYRAPATAVLAAQLGIQALENPLDPMLPLIVDPAEGIDLPFSNAQLVTPPAAPLQAGNMRSTQGVVVQSIGVGLVRSTLKDVVSGGSMSTIWDLTLYVNNESNGKSNTISISGVDESGARAACLRFAAFRVGLLGSDRTSNTEIEFAESLGAGSPAIEYYRIRDAVDPRVGDVQPMPWALGMPFKAVGSGAVAQQNAADPMTSSLNITLKGSVGAVQRKYILKIVCVPDSVIASNQYIGSKNVGDSGITFDAKYRALVDFLTSTTGSAFGITGTHPADEKQIASWSIEAVTDRAKVTTIAAHGYATGDQVKISGQGGWYLSRVWEIEVTDANSFVLRRSQLTTGQKPKRNGKASRVVTAAGVKTAVFYRFMRPSWLDTTPPGAVPVRLTGATPGRRFEPASFRHNRKKIKA